MLKTARPDDNLVDNGTAPSTPALELLAVKKSRLAASKPPRAPS